MDFSSSEKKDNRFGCKKCGVIIKRSNSTNKSIKNSRIYFNFISYFPCILVSRPSHVSMPQLHRERSEQKANNRRRRIVKQRVWGGFYDAATKAEPAGERTRPERQSQTPWRGKIEAKAEEKEVSKPIVQQQF